MKRYLVAGVLAGLTATGFAASDRTGLAQARSEFAINRDGDALVQMANRVAEVRAGDIIQATSEAVTIDTIEGASMLVGSNSQVAFDEQSNIVLKQGVVALAVQRDKKLVVKFQDLLIQPTRIDEESSVNRSVFVTKTEPGNSIVIQAAENNVVVKNAETGEQIAFIATGDTLVLVKDDGGWRTTAAGQGAPFGGFRMQNSTVTETESATEDDDDDDKAGWWWVAGAGVGAAALAGGIIYYEDADDDNDNHRDRKKRKNDDDEERPPITPHRPGPDFPPSEEVGQ